MRSKSFTLLELLVVISIITILAGLILPALIKIKREAKKTSTRILIENIDHVCRQYKNDWGIYPTEDADDFTVNLYAELVYEGNLPGGGKGPYLELDDSRLLTEGSGGICDYWKGAIKYESIGTTVDGTTPVNNTKSFDLWSAGPDETWSTSDDIGNWGR